MVAAESIAMCREWYAASRDPSLWHDLNLTLLAHLMWVKMNLRANVRNLREEVETSMGLFLDHVASIGSTLRSLKCLPHWANLAAVVIDKLIRLDVDFGQLRHLELCLDSETKLCVAQFLQRLPHLTSLNLHTRHSIEDWPFPQLSVADQRLIAALDKMLDLQTVRMSCSILPIDRHLLLHFLQCWTSLKRLELKFSQSSCISYALISPSLEFLSIGGKACLIDTICMPSLTHLLLGDTYLSGFSSKHQEEALLATGCPKLTVFQPQWHYVQ